jgi:HD-GYP domain-containing protein (c-di-GMP phosphodiesterase class II)
MMGILGTAWPRRIVRIKRLRWRIALAAGLGGLLLLLASASILALRSSRAATLDYVLLERIRSVELVSDRLFRDTEGGAAPPRSYTAAAQEHRTDVRALLQGTESISRDVDSLCSQALSAGIIGRSGGKGLDLSLQESCSALRRQWQACRVSLNSQVGPDFESDGLDPAVQTVAEFAPQFRRQLAQVSGLAMRRVEQRHRESELVYGRVLPAVIGLFAFSTLLGAVAFRRRLRITVAASNDLMRGRFLQRTDPLVEDDFSILETKISEISTRMALMLELLDGMQQSRNLKDLCDSLQSILADAMAVRWTGIYYADPSHPVGTQQASSGNSGVYSPDTLAIERHLQAGCLGTLPSETLVAEIPPGDDRSRAGTLHAVWLPSSDWGRHILILATDQPMPWSASDRELLSRLSLVIAHGLQKSELTERLVVAAVIGLSRLAEKKDQETGGHLHRMAEYSRLIAEHYRRLDNIESQSVTDAFVSDVHRFAPMHDIGKVGISDAILRKPGPLTPEEQTEMQRHPVIGGEVLRACSAHIPEMDAGLFQIAIDIAEAHHEKYDGSGFPNGKLGKSIPLAGRIIAVADVIDALASRRPYKPAWPLEKVREYMEAQSGLHFDPDVVQAAIDAMPEIAAIHQEHGYV